MTDSESIKTSCTVAHEHCKCFDYLTDEQRDLIEKNRVTVEFKKGEIIGTAGKTGRSTGVHLDVRLNWYQMKLDPASVLNFEK